MLLFRSNTFSSLILSKILKIRKCKTILLPLNKSRRLRWAVHVARMEEGRSAFKILTVFFQETDLWEGLGVEAGEY